MPFFGGGGGGGDYVITGTNIDGGAGAMPAIIGDNNMALGNGAMAGALNTDRSIAIGNGALPNLSDSADNIAIGYNAAAFAESGFSDYGNIVIGNNTLGAATFGGNGVYENVIIGRNALETFPGEVFQSVILGAGAGIAGGVANVDGAVIIGQNARVNAAGGGSMAIGSQSDALSGAIALGYQANAANNAIAIGQLTVAGNNSIVIGDATHTGVTIGASVKLTQAESFIKCAATSGTFKGLSCKGPGLVSGWASLDAGDDGTASYTAGVVTVSQRGYNAPGDSGAVDLYGGSSMAGFLTAGHVSLWGGWGNNVAGSIGGNVNLKGGDGVAGGGAVNITGGTATAGDGGAITLTTGTGVGAGKKCGAFTLQMGNAVGVNGSPLRIWGGYTSGAFTASEISIDAGYASSPGGTGGRALLSGGGSDGGGPGGPTIIQGGYSTGNFAGGTIAIRAGEGTTGTGNGGDVKLVGGNSAGGTKGSVILYKTDETTKNLQSNDTGLGFFNTAPIAKPTVSGSRGGNPALQSLLTAMASLGLITDSTT